MFKRGVLMLVLAAMLAASSEATTTKDITIQSHLKHPVVKQILHDHGKIKVVLEEAKNAKEAEEDQVIDVDVPKSVLKSLMKDEEQTADVEDEEPEHELVDEQDADVETHKKLSIKAVFTKDEDDEEDNGQEEQLPDDEVDEKHHKKAKHAKDEETDEDVPDEDDDEDRKHKKQVSVTKNEKGETLLKYGNKGSVRISGKMTMKDVKVDAEPAPKLDAAAPPNATTVERDVDLDVGESVVLEFAGHKLKLEVVKNGSLVVHADKEKFALPKADNVDLELTGDIELDEDDTAGSGNKSANAIETPKPLPKTDTEPSILRQVRKDIKLAAKKFTELTTQVVGEDFVSKEYQPVVAVAALVGALACIVGIAAVAVTRVRKNAAAEDPQSVLADEAIEDVEAGIQKKEDEEGDDAPAEKSDSLSDSESDSDSEEGTFANDEGKTASASV